MNFDEKIDELFIDMTEPPIARGSTVGAIKTGKLLHVCGVLPFVSGRIQHPGRVGVDVRTDNAKIAARNAAVMALSFAMQELSGTLNKVKRVVKVEGMVACGAEFIDHTKVIDGASELMTQVFGPYGKHTRSIAGASSLPQNSCVELSVTFELK